MESTCYTTEAMSLCSFNQKAISSRFLLYLEVIPDIIHAPLDKEFPCFLLQWLASNVEGMYIYQVVDATDVHPVPGGNLQGGKAIEE